VINQAENIMLEKCGNPQTQHFDQKIIMRGNERRSL
jgi:hypothetical protein